MTYDLAIETNIHVVFPALVKILVLHTFHYDLLSLIVSSWDHLLGVVYKHVQQQTRLWCHMNSPELKLGHWILI